MSFTATEAFTSRDVRQGVDIARTEVFFVVKADPGDVVDENDVKDFLLGGGIPQFIDGLPLFEVEVSQRVNAEIYKTKATYEVADPEGEEDEIPASGQTEQFDTTGGMIHKEWANDVVSSQGAVDSNTVGAINYDGEKIQGVDIVVPSYRFTLTVQKLESEVTQDYQKRLFELSGHINVGSLRFFNDSEVLFIGAVGSKTRENQKNANGTPKEDIWEITYHFDCRLTETDVRIGAFVIAEVKGWDYVTVVYEDIAPNAAIGITRAAKSVAVLKLFPQASFIELGIGLI